MNLREDPALLALVEKHLDDTTLVRREDTSTTTARARAVLAALEPYLADGGALAAIARRALATPSVEVEVNDPQHGWGHTLTLGHTLLPITEQEAELLRRLRNTASLPA